MKVLVVEDSPGQLKLARVVLSFDGHSVTEADAAERAFASIKSDRPDIILLDLALPGIDGLVLARLLKADPDTRDIHIVAVTAHSNKFTRGAALQAGCDAYFPKPINTRELSNQLTSTRAVGASHP